MYYVATGFSLIGKSSITGSFSTVFLYTPEIYPTNYRYVRSYSVGNISFSIFSQNKMVVGCVLVPFHHCKAVTLSDFVSSLQYIDLFLLHNILFKYSCQWKIPMLSVSCTLHPHASVMNRVAVL